MRMRKKYEISQVRRATVHLKANLDKRKGIFGVYIASVDSNGVYEVKFFNKPLTDENLNSYIMKFDDAYVVQTSGELQDEQ